jgi:hypothetical protein
MIRYPSTSSEWLIEESGEADTKAGTWTWLASSAAMSAENIRRRSDSPKIAPEGESIAQREDKEEEANKM